MDPRYRFYETKKLYFYYNLNYSRIEVSNNDNYPALPFICSDKKSYKYKPYHNFPQHNLYYMLADDGNDLNEEQQKAIRAYKATYSSYPTYVPLTISEQNVLDLIEIFQNSLSQYQLMHIMAANLNQKTL